MIAALAATRTDEVSYVVMLAAPSVRAAEVYEERLKAIHRLTGATEVQTKRQLALRREIYRLATGSETADQITRSIVESDRESPGSFYPSGEALTSYVQDFVRPVFRSELRHDPTVALKQLKQPILALYGDQDVHVAARQNVPVTKAMVARKHPDSRVLLLPGRTHTFRRSRDFGFTYDSDQTVDAEVLDLIVSWILSRSVAPKFEAFE